VGCAIVLGRGPRSVEGREWAAEAYSVCPLAVASRDETSFTVVPRGGTATYR
jgi:hypothetical protein